MGGIGNENKTCNGNVSHFGDEDHNYTSSMERKQEAYFKYSQAYPQLLQMMAKHEIMEIDSDYSWIGVEKAQPWWRTIDRDELACFVSRKSLNLIQNYDLPPPQKYLRGQTCADINNIKIRTLSFDWEAEFSAFSNFNVQAKGGVESGLMHRNHGPSSNKGHLHFDCDKYSSYPIIHRSVTEQVFEGNLSKAQVMEALCHFQTRAREAEELEALNTQVKNKHQPISTLFPWIGRKLRKRKLKGKPRSDTTTYVVAIVLGLSLVGGWLALRMDYW